ncbi:hypothetical protein GCM10027440_20870 [Nocardiopsis coralliicola]
MRPYARVHLPGTLDAAARARTWVRRCVTAFSDGDPHLADTAELAVSEAVTNALTHTLSGRKGGSVSLLYIPTALGARIEVHDCGNLRATHVPHLRAADPDAEHGRGLGIIAAVAHEWGLLARPDTGVWFTVTRQSG